MLSKKRISLTAALFLITPLPCRASHFDPNHPGHLTDLAAADAPTAGLFGIADELAESGIELSLSATGIYQQNVRGGLSTHRRAGRFTGSYDLEVSADLERLLGLPTTELYILTEGCWSEGINAPPVGSNFSVNDDARGRWPIAVTELRYEQSLLDEQLRIRIGKLDLTGGFECRGCPVSFDGSAFANDETTQFLNSALVNNPGIPFPDYGLGIIAHYSPIEWWYVSAGLADAEADVRETGLRTAFFGRDYFFYIFETGVTPRLSSAKGPLQGAYRLGVWYDPKPKTRFSGTTSKRDDVGFYTSCDQLLYKENTDPQDTQGLGVFVRYGWADSEVNDITGFWSAGLQYRGLLAGRNDDVLGVGFAQGFFSDQASDTYTEDCESAVEIYYNAPLAKGFNITPSLQYVANPGGTEEISNAVVIGVRLQIQF